MVRRAFGRTSLRVGSNSSMRKRDTLIYVSCQRRTILIVLGDRGLLSGALIRKFCPPRRQWARNGASRVNPLSLCFHNTSSVTICSTHSFRRFVDES